MVTQDPAALQSWGVVGAALMPMQRAVRPASSAAVQTHSAWCPQCLVPWPRPSLKPLLLQGHHLRSQQLLTGQGVSCAHIYSALDQTARKINLAKFTHNKCSTLIVTDLAARGLDIPLLDNVINYSFPAKGKLFLHRVGEEPSCTGGFREGPLDHAGSWEFGGTESLSNVY